MNPLAFARRAESIILRWITGHGKTASVLGICEEAQHRSQVTTRREVWPHLDVYFLPEMQHVPGQLFVANLVADKSVLAVVSSASK